MQPSVSSELQRLWLDARCTPPTAAQHNEKVSEFLSVFVATFTSRASPTFRTLFSDGAALAGLLCRDFATLARRLTHDDAPPAPSAAALATVQLFSQALHLLISDGTISTTEVGRLASAYESFANFNVVALALVLHDRLLSSIQACASNVAEWGAMAQTDTLLLQLVSDIVSCRRKELTRRSMLEAVLPERIVSVAATALVYFASVPEKVGVEAAAASSSILHQQLPNALDVGTVAEVLRGMESALVSSQRRPAGAAAAVHSLSCFAYALENIIYAKQLAGFAPVESVSFDVITATVLNLGNEVGEAGLPALRRVVGCLRVLALAERPDLTSRQPDNASITGSLFRMLPASVGKIQQRLVDSWGSGSGSSGDRREASQGVHCGAAVDALARVFVLTTERQTAELCGQQLFQLLSMPGVSTALLGFVLSICAESAPLFDAPKLRSLLAFVGTRPCKSEVGDFLQSILAHLRCGRLRQTEQRLAVVDFFTEWCPKASTHTAVSLALGVVQACVHCMAQLAEDPRGGDVEAFAERFSVLAKVVLGSREAASSLSGDNCCASLLEVMLSSLERGQLHTAVLLRDAFVGLVLKTNLFCDVLLGHIASATETTPWTAVATPLLSTLALLLRSCGRHNRASLPHNCIELCLSLTPLVDSGSRHPSVDRHLLDCCLGLVLTLVNYSDVWEVVERTLGELPAQRSNVQSMLDLCTGVLRTSESLGVAEQYFTHPDEEEEEAATAVRRSGSSVVLHGPFAVLAEPYVEMLYPVKLLVRMADTMLADQHADAASATDAIEHLLLRSGVAVPNSYVADFIVRWERFAWVRCVSNVCDPRLLPLFFGGAASVPTVQKSQRVWLEALAASVGGQEMLSCSDYVHLGEGGGAWGRVSCTGDAWPPLDAYTTSMWLYVDPASLSGRQEGRVALWQLEWDAMGRHVCVSLMAHTQRQCCLYSCDVGGDVTVVELPALPERRWVHVATSHARGKVFASQLRAYLDGVEVARTGCPYPAGGLQAAAAVATALPALLHREIEVTLGSPQDTPSTHAAVRLVGFQLYGCGASLRQVSSLYAMGPYPSSQAWDTAGQQLYDLRAPCLCDEVVRLVEASLQSASLEGVLRDQSVVLACPPAARLLDVHATAMEQVSTGYGYLNNKQWALRNLAAPSAAPLRLHGYYRPPRDSHTNSVDALLCNGAVYEWMRWMRCIAAGVVDAERVDGPAGEAAMAAVQQTAYKMLRVLSLAKKQTDLLPRSWRRFTAQLAEHVTRHPKIYLHHPTAAAQLLRVCVRTVRYRDKHRRLVDGLLLTNLLPLEHIFFNWRLLSNLPDESWLALTATLRQLVSPSNALAGVNTARLLTADVVNGFILGLLREYVPFPRLVAAVDLVKGVLLTGHATEELMERLLTAVVLTVPGPRQGGSGSTVASHLGSKLTTTSFAYLVLVRNMLLRCVNEALETTLNDGSDAFVAAFVSTVPDWWFTAMLSGNSHPVSATLTMRLFVLCFLNSKTFREDCTAAKAECIATAMEPHCHQRELMDILVQGYMGHLWAASSSHAPYSTMGWSGRTEMEGLLALILHLVKSQCLLLLRGAPVTSEECTVRGYFSVAAAEATSAVAAGAGRAAIVRRWRRVRFVVAALCRMRAAAGGEAAARGDKSVVYAVAVAQYPAPVATLKDSICEVLAWLTQSYQLSSSLSKSLYQSNKSVNLLDLLMWPVLVALSPKESAAAHLSTSADSPTRTAAPDGGDGVVDAPAPLSDASTDEGEEEDEDEEWEVLPDAATDETRSFGLDAMEPAAGMEAVHDACKVFFLAHAVSRASTTSLLAIARGSTKMSKHVLALHRALSAEVKGVGHHAEDARKAFLCFVWLKASEQAVDRTPDGGGASAARRNALELGKYTLDRLVSGGAVPPAAVASFYRFLLTRLDRDAEVAKSSRTALFEWFMYVTSASFYKLDAAKVGVVVDMAYGCADVLFASPMPATELLRVVVGRLLQVTVCLWNSVADDTHGAIRKMAALWKAALSANQRNPSLASLFVCGPPAGDTYHGGFDLLLPPVASAEAFAVWLRHHRGDVAQLLQSYMGLTYAFVMANGSEHARLIARYTAVSLAESDRRRRHATAMVAAHWQQWRGSLLTTTFVDAALLSCTASRYPNCYVLNNGGAAVGGAEDMVCSEWAMNDSGAVGRGRRYASENVDEVTSDPLSFYIRYAPPVCLPLRRQHAPGPAVMLRANARSVVAKVAGHDAGASVVFVSNAYLVLGTESYICTCTLTQQELILITCSAITPAGDFFAEQVRVHTAAQQSNAKASLLQQAFRRLLSGQNRAGGSTSSQAAFRYSQYYRHLQTESAKGSNALVWRFPLGSITSVHQRLFQHLSAGLEVVLESGTAVFLVLLDDELSFSKASRDRLFSYFDSDTDPLLAGIAAHSMNEKLAKLGIWTRRWVRRECSNYTYLRVLNDVASRTTANLGQYPVLPWVLRSYTDDTLDLEDAGAYRDLSKPVGALNEAKAKQLQARYAEWISGDAVADPPYHYGTHYSTAAIVLYYLVRLQPFTSRAIRFQGGRLDTADRLFHSVSEAWANSSGRGSGDVKELTPEFFRVSAFLENRNGVHLGTRSDGVALGDVALPPWCGGSSVAFVYMNALALESPAASERLHQWIDLIFGYRQTGQGAVEAINVFSPLSYKEGVERAISRAATEEDRKSIVATADNFGQTPLQLFSRDPHPPRRDAQQARTTQAYMLDTVTDVSTRPCLAAQLVGRPEGGISVLAVTDDTLFMGDRLSAVAPARPVQVFRYDADSDSIACTTARGDRVSATVRQVRSSGGGGARCLCASPRGSVVCVGMDSGGVIVYGRESSRHRFYIVAQLDCTNAEVLRDAGAVSSLHLMDDGVLLVAYERDSAVSGWHLSILATTFTFAATFATPDDRTPVQAISADAHTGLYYAAKANSLVIFSAGGVVLTQLNMDALLMSAAPEYATGMSGSRVTSLLLANCASFSLTNLMLLGHSNGTVSLWCVVATQSMAAGPGAAQPPLWSFQFLHEVVFPAAVTCIAASAEELSFVVALADHTAHYIFFPTSELDSQ
ncbi:Concanavalin A-like lectin/glucanases superfamily/Beige/BEACH domain containing protein [Novymonas esmeraldas]|uniref:Concanavalin A-like lectin/glucanases superfamily/Beige/BEACH domain containing protein n=1 Tax=Novymonas esmeraldas TaxID=1808958 RepID=A0AAW0EYK0_9TRYP